MTRKIKKVVLIALAAAVLVVLRASLGVADVQADMTGTWTVTFSPPSGDRDTTWEIEQHDDGTLTGEIGLLQGSAPAHDGWVEDKAFRFITTQNRRGQTFDIVYEGTFTDNALEGSILLKALFFTAAFTGVRAASEEDDR